jgi:peptide deformylase
MSQKNGSLLNVVIHPDPRLRQLSAKVEKVDDLIRHDLDVLAKCMYHHNGVGIAGVQVGIMKKLFVVDQDYIVRRTAGSATPLLGKPLYFANAEIIEKSNEMILLPDGCISVPNVFSKTQRHANITVKFLDYNNQVQTMQASGLLGFCIQHEIDHTNGKLFFDLLSPLKRKLLLDQYAKYLKSRKTEEGIAM